MVEALLIPACIETEVSAAALATVRSFAAELGVRSHWLTTLGALHRRRVFAVQRQLFRRSPDGRRVLARTVAPEARFFADANDMIGSDLVDAVIISAPPSFHEPLTLAALAALALWRFKWGVIPVIAACATAGLLLRWFGLA